MKLIYVIKIYKSILPMKNGLNGINILYTGSRKSVYRLTQKCPHTLWPIGGFLKRNLAYIYCTNYNEINKFY